MARQPDGQMASQMARRPDSQMARRPEGQTARGPDGQTANWVGSLALSEGQPSAEDATPAWSHSCQATALALRRSVIHAWRELEGTSPALHPGRTLVHVDHRQMMWGLGGLATFRRILVCLAHFG